MGVKRPRSAEDIITALEQNGNDQEELYQQFKDYQDDDPDSDEFWQSIDYEYEMLSLNSSAEHGQSSDPGEISVPSSSLSVEQEGEKPQVSVASLSSNTITESTRGDEAVEETEFSQDEIHYDYSVDLSTTSPDGASQQLIPNNNTSVASIASAGITTDHELPTPDSSTKDGQYSDNGKGPVPLSSHSVELEDEKPQGMTAASNSNVMTVMDVEYNQDEIHYDCSVAVDSSMSSSGFSPQRLIPLDNISAVEETGEPLPNNNSTDSSLRGEATDKQLGLSSVPVVRTSNNHYANPEQTTDLVFDVVRKNPLATCQPDTTPKTLKILQQLSSQSAADGSSGKKQKSKQIMQQMLSSDPNAFSIAKIAIAENPMIVYQNELYFYQDNGQPVYVRLVQWQQERFIYNHYARLFDSAGKTRLVSETCKALRYSATEITVEEMNEVERQYLATRNVIFDVLSGESYPLTPKIPLTYFLEVEYNKKKSYHPVCSFVIETIADGDDAIVDAIWEMISYYLFPSPTMKHFFVLIGPSNSGKSVIADLIQSFFPSTVISNLSLQDFNGSFSTGTFAKSRLNVEADLPETKISSKAMSVLKKITGGDKIQANQKHKQSFTCKPRTKLLFASNFALRLEREDEAFENRLHIIPFNVVIPKDERDPDLQDKLQEEKAAIFNTAYKYYCKLRENNFTFTEIELPESTETFYGPKYDPRIQEFFNEYLEYTGDIKDNVLTSDLAERFQEFWETRYTDKQPDFSQHFARFIKESSMNKVRNTRRGSKKPHGYCGLRFTRL